MTATNNIYNINKEKIVEEDRTGRPPILVRYWMMVFVQNLNGP